MEPVVVAHRDHRSERRREPAYRQCLEIAGPGGRLAEQPPKCLVEAAQRIESMIQRRSGHAFSSLDAPERQSQTARARVGLKRHRVLGQEPAPHAIGVEPQATEILIAPAARRLAFDFGEERSQPFRRLAGGLERPAAQAGPEARDECLAGRRVEGDMSRQRLLRRAGRTAEDSGGAHGGHEHAVIAGVSGHHRGEHLVARRQRHRFHGPEVRGFLAEPLPEIRRGIPFDSSGDGAKLRPMVPALLLLPILLAEPCLPPPLMLRLIRECRTMRLVRLGSRTERTPRPLRS